MKRVFVVMEDGLPSHVMSDDFDVMVGFVGLTERDELLVIQSDKQPRAVEVAFGGIEKLAEH